MKLFGKYAGTVFDANDPKKQGRIRAYVPKAGFDTFPTAWALPAFPFAGFWAPPIQNTKVWIEFEAGDANFPIWTGVFYGAPGGRSEGPSNATIPGDIVIEFLGKILAKVTGNWEEEALQRIIEAATIKLGKTATEALIKESFGNLAYNLHTHVAPTGGGTTSTPSLQFVPATHATLKVKGE